MTKRMIVQAALVIALPWWVPIPQAMAEPSLANDGSSFVNGVHVDDATGLRIQEDDPRWSCVDDGNRICGPGNANGVPAGCYDDGGVLVAAWPCHVVVNRDGSSDVYKP